MKKYLIIGSLIVVVGLIAACILLLVEKNKYAVMYERSAANEKSLIQRINTVEGDIIAYESNINNLRGTKDSLIQELLRTKDSLSIKDKMVQALMNTHTEIVTHDTLRLTDTIFKEKSFILDTAIGDKWYTSRLFMAYPSEIRLSTTMISDKDVVIYSSRETIDPPKKFFLCRWFQKKHTVTRVSIQEKNPHIVSEQSVYIKVSQ